MTTPKPGPRLAERADRRRPLFFDRSAEPGTVPRRREAALASAQVEVQRLSSALGALGGRGEQDLDLDAERFYRQVPVALGALDRLLMAMADPSGPRLPSPERRPTAPQRLPEPAGGWSPAPASGGAR